VIKSLFASKPFNHLDLNCLAIGQPVPIQNVDLQQKAAIGFYGGPPAKAGHTRQWLSGQPMDADSKNPDGNEVIWHGEVEGREPQLAAKLLAIPNPATERVGPSQQTAHKAEVAVGQGLSDPRTRDFQPPLDHLRDSLGLKAVLLPEARQKANVTGSSVTKSKILSYHHQTTLQYSDQDLLDELLRTQAGHGLVKSQEMGATKPRSCQGIELVSQRQDEARRLLGAEKLSWMRLKTADRWDQSLRPSDSLDATNQGLMTEMEAIKAANCDGGAGRILLRRAAEGSGASG